MIYPSHASLLQKKSIYPKTLMTLRSISTRSKLDHGAMQDLWDGKSTSNDAQIIQQQLKRVLIKTELKTAEIFPQKLTTTAYTTYRRLYAVHIAINITKTYQEYYISLLAHN